MQATQEFLTAEQVGKILHIESIKIVRRELKKALFIKDSGVFKYGKSYLIDKTTYLNYLLSRNKKEIKCEENKKTQKEFTNEVMSGGCLIPQEEDNIVNQLTSRIKKKQ